MSTCLLECDNLRRCDEYLHGVLSGKFLGDLEPWEGELVHLSDIIAQGLKECPSDLQGSLSLATFLVWMGWREYQEGNYWGQVYQKLGLPSEQIKWQGVLGKAFLEAIKKYKLYNFRGKLPYIIPILAHGYIPNCYLEDYFENVLLPIYIDREKSELEIKQEEVEHLILSWRNDYVGYARCQGEINNLERKEDKLTNICDAWRHRDLLIRLHSLREKLMQNEELSELLSFPENWLDKLKVEQAKCKELLGTRQERLERHQTIQDSLNAKDIEIKVLNNDVKQVANRIIDEWNENFTDYILNLPLKRINVLFQKTQNLFGLRGYILRFFAPAKYKKLFNDKQQLEEFLSYLPIKRRLIADPWPELPENLFKLQNLLLQRSNAIQIISEINATKREIGVSNQEMCVVDLIELRVKLDKLTQGLASYKTKLVMLGKGDIEKGKEILVEQRELRREIDQLRKKFPGNVDALLPYVSAVKACSDIKKFEFELVATRKEKKRVAEHAKIYSNPLYQLNKSTRIFILQGGEKAVEFIYESLVLLNKLQEGKFDDEFMLPNRIKEKMVGWWEQKGKTLLETAWEDRTKNRGSITDKIIVRKPIIRFDLDYKEIKVMLPRQPVKQKVTAKFYIRGKSGRIQEITLPLMLENGVYWSESAELQLKHPEQSYSMVFKCGDEIRSWESNGIGWDSYCMLFNKQGELISDGQLPEEGMYITPVGSSVEPKEFIKEKLSGDWSGYEYRYIDLEDLDAVVVRIGKHLSIYKRVVQLQPKLTSADVIGGIRTGDFKIYQRRLPDLLFSISNQEELQFYGIRIDVQGNTLFWSLKDLETVTIGNVVHLPLKDLVQNKYGLYKITLEKRGNIFWSEECAVVPDLQLNFDQQAYSVQDNFREKGKLEFYSRYKCEFIPDLVESALVSRFSINVIEFDTKLDVIKGSLVYYLDSKLSLKTGIQVPGIRWRKAGANWKAEVEEIWHEDLGDIEVKVPAAAGKKINLSLGEGRQVISSHEQQGVAVFSLQRFSDTLRRSDEPLQEVFLFYANKGIPPSLLLRVRTRWQVEKVNLTQHLQEGNRHILMEWVDLGRAINRVICLWPINMPGVDYIEEEIPNGDCRITIMKPVERIPPGSYRVHILMLDPWGSDMALMPDQTTENCKDVDIGTKEELLKSYLRKRIEVVALYYKGQKIKLETDYWLEVIEINPTFEEEIRLVGNFYSSSKDGVIMEMPFNPVSFYIKDHEIPFLIDKDGDGVTYCRKCKVMFWEVAHMECSDAVLMPDAILIKVRDKL